MRLASAWNLCLPSNLAWLGNDFLAHAGEPNRLTRVRKSWLLSHVIPSCCLKPLMKRQQPDASCRTKQRKQISLCFAGWDKARLARRATPVKIPSTPIVILPSYPGNHDLQTIESRASTNNWPTAGKRFSGRELVVAPWGSDPAAAGAGKDMVEAGKETVLEGFCFMLFHGSNRRLQILLVTHRTGAH